MSLNPRASVEAHALYFNAHNKLVDLLEDKVPDCIVCCADTPPTQIEIEALLLANKLNVPCVFAGVGFMHGFFGPFLVKSHQKEKYVKTLLQRLNVYNNVTSQPLNMSIAFTNTVISSLLAMDISLFLIGKEPKSLDRIIHVSFDNLRFESNII